MSVTSWCWSHAFLLHKSNTETTMSQRPPGGYGSQKKHTLDQAEVHTVKKKIMHNLFFNVTITIFRPGHPFSRSLAVSFWINSTDFDYFDNRYTRLWGGMTCKKRLSLSLHFLFFFELLLMKAIIVAQPNQHPQLPLREKKKAWGWFCLREEPWDWARPGNKVYGNSVLITDVALIASRLSKNPILWKEAAIRIIYWISSKKISWVWSRDRFAASLVVLVRI